MRYEQRPPPDLPDPLNVLRSILGLPLQVESKDKDDLSAGVAQLPPMEVATDIDFGGLSLDEYLHQHSEYKRRPPSAGQEQNIRVERQKYQDFHNSVSECDEVLGSVESYLAQFKADLGQVSAEIENLQARSVHINTKLENRRNVEKLLGPAVEELSLSPLTVRAIAEGPVDEHFIQALREVENRSAAIQTKFSSSGPVKATEDLQPLLSDLKAKAVERIRDFIVAQIKALRSPNINAQVVQQQTFVKSKDLYSFLVRNHAVLAEEIGQAYVNTMRWYYSSNFSRYLQALEKLQIHDVDETLGGEISAPRRNVLTSSRPTPPPHDAFSLGRRADLLKSKNEAAISSYLAEESKSWHYLETPFRNFNQALIDNVCAEYAVASDLFAANGFHQVSRRVSEIFEPTFSLGHALTKSLLENTTDCLGVLLCVRLNQHHAFELQRRKVPVADSYINYTNILLWPRFQVIMDMHCESLKKVPTNASRGANAAFSLVGGADTSRASLAPHAITQRFGQFLQGLLALNAEAADEEPVSNSLGRLRTEFEVLMGKLAKGVGDASKRNRFLYNNYSLVLTIISDTQGRLAEEQKKHFGALMRDTKVK